MPKYNKCKFNLLKRCKTPWIEGRRVAYALGNLYYSWNYHEVVWRMWFIL